MAINFASEQVVTLTDATQLLPRRRAGRKPHVSTIYRWASRGIKGILLETLVVGGTTCTSVEALQRFFDAVSQHTTSHRHLQPSLDKARLQKAAKLLDDAGI